MATISELNIRLGLVTRDFDRALAKVERDFRTTGNRLSRLGSDIALAISAPLAAFGFSAIQAAGDVESLRLAMRATFEGAGRSIREADAELEALRKSALAPGLDFEQAVKASVRLQNVGFAAETARKTIEELANAVATTGGTAQDLDEVTNQFSQMIGKGKIFQDDIKIILGRMPILARIMQDTFGTTTAEGLNKLGIDARTFVDTVVAKMAELPRVSGGIKNALVNLAASVRNSLAGLGDEIDKAFNLSKLSDEISAKVAGLVTWFKSLDDGTKRIIVEFGVFLVAAGPLVKLFGALYGGAAQMVGIFRSVVQASTPLLTFFVGLTQSTKSLPGYFGDFARGMLGAGEAAAKMRLAVVAATGGLAAVVIGVAAAVYALSDNFDAAKFAADQFNKAQEATIEQAAKESAALNQNFAVLLDVKSGTEERKKAIAALQAAYPDYLRNINLESASASELTEIQRGLNDQILRGVAERQKAAAVNAIYEKQAQILLRIQQIQRTGDISVKEATLINTGDLLRKGSNAAAVIEKLQQQVADLGTQANVTAKDFDKAFGLQHQVIDPLLEAQYRARQADEDAKDALLGYGDAAKKSASATHVFTGSVNAAGDGLSKKMRTALDSVKANLAAFDERLKLFGPSADSAQKRNDLLAKSIDRLLKAGFSATSEQVKHLRDELTAAAGAAGAADVSLGDLANQFHAVAAGSAQMNASVAAGAALTDDMRTALAAVSGDLDAFAANVLKYGPSAETAAERNDLLTASITRLEKAGFSATSDQVQALNAELKDNGATSEKAAQNLESLAGKFKSVATGASTLNTAISAGNALNERQRAALDTVADSLAAFDDRLKAYGPSADSAKKRNELLAASIDNLLKAGFSATSEQVQALNAQLAAGTEVTDELKRAYDALRASWAKPAEFKVPQASFPTLPVANPLDVGVPDTGSTIPNPVDTISLGALVEGLQAINALTAGIQNLNENALTPTQALMKSLSDGTLGFSEAWQAAGEIVSNSGSVMQQAIYAAGGAIMQTAADGTKGFSDLAKSAVSAAARVVRAWILQGVAGAVSKALTFLPFPANLAAGAIAGAAAAALFSKAISAIGIPALAGGGVVSSPTLALVGEYPGARRNPEIIAPENKLRQIFSDELGAGGSGQLVAVVRGDDLHFILDKAAARRTRRR